MPGLETGAGEFRSPLPVSRVPAICILFGGLIAAWLPPFFAIVPHDFLEFLLPWYQHIKAVGPIGAFAHPFSNYTPPYLYLLAAFSLLKLTPLVAIKLLSSVGALWVSYAIGRLLNAAGGRQALEASLAALLLPTVLLNAPILAQADMFWVAPCLLAVAAAYRDRWAWMAFWAGVGFAFKAQAVFLAPFVVALLIYRRAPLWHCVLPILVYVAAIVPAWLAGWPLTDLLTIYLRQEQYVPPNGVRYVSTAANWWALFAYLDYGRALQSFWIGFFAAAVAVVVYLRVMATRPTQLLLASAISSTMLPFVLPGMHERFYALGELTVFCLAWICRAHRTAIAALLMQAQLLLAYFGWLLQRPQLAIAGAGLVTIVLWLLLKELSDSVQGTFTRRDSFTISQLGAGYGAD